MTAEPSLILWHGPGARAEAVRELSESGRQIPTREYGSGLAKEQAREVVAVMGTTCLKPSGFLLGPMDEVRPETADVLLKSLEDYEGKGPRPYLWARDLGSVMPTIVSRTLTRWCPGEDERVAPFRKTAETILDKYAAGDGYELSQLILSQEDRETLVAAVVEALLPKMEAGVEWAAPLYERVSRLPGLQITDPRLLAAFLPGP